MRGARRRAFGLRSVPWLLGALALISCAKKGAPTGGPPDIEAPRLIASFPDSGAAKVPRHALLSLTFSEGMEPNSTGDAISLAPRVDIRQRHWKGRTVTLVLAETLRAGQTYALFMGGGARDRHGNSLASGATVVFSTADSMPRGALEGKLVARGFSANGTYLWCYDAASGKTPDSTARDFDAIGVADREGFFRVVGLPVPGRYRLWVFADLNGNRSFEPDADILSAVDTTLSLTPDAPVARGLSVTVSNPRSPGRVRGTVLDSLGIREGELWVMALAAADSLRRVATKADSEGHYEMSLAAGAWRLRAWRDLDRSRDWQRDREPASGERRVEVVPAGETPGVDLVLVPAPGAR